MQNNRQKVFELLRKINQNHESYDFEVKEALHNLPKNTWETYSAFANTSGGILLFGIKENKVTKEFIIEGVNDPDKLIKDFVTTAQNRNKVSINLVQNEDIEIFDLNEKQVVVIYIREASIRQKPVYINGIDSYQHVYIRKYEGDCRATQEEYRRFVRNTQDNVDEELLNYFTVDDLDNESILLFKNIVDSRNKKKNYLGMDNVNFLKEMGIFQIDRNDKRKLKLTLAGLLFLGKFDAIRQRLPHFHLEYLNKKCAANIRWKDRVSTGDLEYENLNLFKFYFIVLEKLKLTIEDPFELEDGCVRKTTNELEVALREALANTLIHADYLDAETNITIEVHYLYYSFLNPGTMRVSKEQFFSGGKSSPRNNILISYFRRMGASERAGSGGKEISDVVLKNSFRYPELKTDIDKTYLKIWCASLENSYSEYDSCTRDILLYIQKNKIVKFSDIRDHVGNVSDYQIRKSLALIINKDLVYVEGVGKATKYYWKMTTLEKVATAQFLSNILLKN